MEKPQARGACGVVQGEIAGVVAETIAASAYGLVQVWGYHSAVRVKSSTTATGAVAKGSALAGCVTAYYALSNTPDTGTHANFHIKGIALAAQALYTTIGYRRFHPVPVNPNLGRDRLPKLYDNAGYNLVKGGDEPGHTQAGRGCCPGGGETEYSGNIRAQVESDGR